MSLSNPNKPVTEQRLQEFYHEIEPYMGGGGGTSGGGHTIEDSEGTALTQRDALQFGDGFNATDDSENEKTVVEPNLMTAADMDDVVTPLPSVQSRYHKYSTEEQIVGEWIDGKPLYQKTIVTTTPIVTTDGTYVTKNIPLDISNMGSVKFIEDVFVIDGDNLSRKLPYLMNSGIQTKASLASTYIQLISGSVSMSEKPCYVTIRYTKTTS